MKISIYNKITLSLNYKNMNKVQVQKTSTLKSPIGRVGGKSKLSKEIVWLFPSHKHYVEVFGWWLSVFFAKEPSKLETVNDINNDLINLWQVIKNYPQSLSHYLNLLFVSRVIFNNIKASKYTPRNHIEKAAYFYYMIAQSFWSMRSHFAMNAKSWRKPKNLWKSFTKWSQRFKFVTIEKMSFKDILNKYDKEDVFFYLDPPYYEYEDYYTGWFNKSQHILLRDTLKNIKWKFLLSYNDCSEIRELYKGFHIRSTKEIAYTLWWNTKSKQKLVSELYISNY